MNPIKRTRQTTPTIQSSRRITFYPSVFNDPTTITGDDTPFGQVPFTEIIRPGAFQSYLATGGEVVADVNHDKGQVYAKRTSGELVLAEDEHGLFATCYLPMSRIGQKVLDAAIAGQISGASFDGMPTKENWTAGLTPIREVYQIDLRDVCVAIGSMPAYSNTPVQLLRTRKDAELKEFLTRLRIIKVKG